MHLNRIRLNFNALVLSSLGSMIVLILPFVLLFAAFLGINPTTYTFRGYVMLLTPIVLVGASLSSFIIAHGQVRVIDALKLTFPHWVISTVVGFSLGHLLTTILFYPTLLVTELMAYSSDFTALIVIGALTLLPGLFTGLAQQFHLPDNYNKTAWVSLSIVIWLLPVLFILLLQFTGDAIQSTIPYVTESFLGWAFLAFAALGGGAATVGITRAYIKRQETAQS